MDVHLRELRYFLAVAERLHFTRAAEDLYISQPALSKQIRALESQLGVALFVRGAKGVTLTPAGLDLLPEAQRTVAAWTEAQRVLDRGRDERETSIVIGFSTGLGRGLVPAVRARLGVLAPRITLSLQQVGWADPTGGVRSETTTPTDAAFVWLPVPDGTALNSMVVATEPRVVALRSDHPLAAKPKVDFRDLLDEPFIALPHASGTLRDHWLATDAREGHPVTVGAEAASTEETYEALSAGLGVCLIAAGNAPLIARDVVTVRPVTEITPSQLALVWRDDDTRWSIKQLRSAVFELVSGLNGE